MLWLVHSSFLVAFVLIPKVHVRSSRVLSENRLFEISFSHWHDNQMGAMDKPQVILPFIYVYIYIYIYTNIMILYTHVWFHPMMSSYVILSPHICFKTSKLERRCCLRAPGVDDLFGVRWFCPWGWPLFGPRDLQLQISWDMLFHIFSVLLFQRFNILWIKSSLCSCCSNLVKKLRVGVWILLSGWSVSQLMWRTRGTTPIATGWSCQ